jgi:hypothetical protein
MARTEQPNQIAPDRTYQVAVSQIGLVSQEIYNRCTAMLTVHGFLMAAVALFLSSSPDRGFSYVISIGICAAGIALCILWRGFVSHGVHAQEFFRQCAARTEELYGNSIDIFRDLRKSCLVEEGKPAPKESTFERTASHLILVFEWLYGALAILCLVLLLAPSLRGGELAGHANITGRDRRTQETLSTWNISEKPLLGDVGSVPARIDMKEPDGVPKSREWDEKLCPNEPGERWGQSYVTGADSVGNDHLTGKNTP